MKQRMGVNSLISLILFTLFALSMLLCLLFCASRYAALTENGQSAFESRTAGAFFSTKVRQCDDMGKISIEAICECSALAFSESIDGEDYVSYIYCHDGYLKELFTLADIEHLPEDGEKLFALDSVSFSLDGRTLSIEYQSDLGVSSLILALRTGKEG